MELSFRSIRASQIFYSFYDVRLGSVATLTCLFLNIHLNEVYEQGEVLCGLCGLFELMLNFLKAPSECSAIYPGCSPPAAAPFTSELQVPAHSTWLASFHTSLSFLLHYLDRFSVNGIK